MGLAAITQACSIFSALAKEYTPNVRATMPTRNAVRALVETLKEDIVSHQCDNEEEKTMQRDLFLIWAFMVILEKNYASLDFDAPYVAVQTTDDIATCASLDEVYTRRYDISDSRIAALVYCIHSSPEKLTCESMRIRSAVDITVDDKHVGYKLDQEAGLPFVLGCTIASWVYEDVQLTLDLALDIRLDSLLGSEGFTNTGAAPGRVSDGSHGGQSANEITLGSGVRRLHRALTNFYTPDLYESCIMNIINFHLRPEDMYAYVENCPPMRPVGQFYPEATNEFVKAVLTIEVDRALRRGSPQTLETVFARDDAASGGERAVDADDIVSAKDPSMAFAPDPDGTNTDFWPLLSLVVLRACMKHYDNVDFALYTDGRMPRDQSRHVWHDMFSRQAYVYDHRNKLYFTGTDVATKMLSLYPHTQTYKVAFCPNTLPPTAPILQLLSVE